MISLLTVISYGTFWGCQPGARGGVWVGVYTEAEEAAAKLEAEAAAAKREAAAVKREAAVAKREAEAAAAAKEAEAATRQWQPAEAAPYLIIRPGCTK